MTSFDGTGEEGAAATGLLDNGERTPPGAGAAATGDLDDSERVLPGS